MSRPTRVTHIALLLASILFSVINATPTSRSASTITVKAGQSIQSAINQAANGTRIHVEAGTYAEQLLITKDGIKLVGKNAILVPPETYATNLCTGLAGPLQSDTGDTQAGICIYGSGVVLGPPLPPSDGQEHRKVTCVGAYVKDVSVEGFEVNGFSGLNIAVVGAQNAEVRKNKVSDGFRYGILTVGSKKSLITRNTVSSSDLKFIGICMDDKSDVSVTQNEISAYYIGLCVQTNKADVGHNKVSNICIGAFVDPGIDGASLTHNKFNGTNPICVFAGLGSIGIAVVGATNTNVQHNDVSGISDGKIPDNIAAGIALFDAPPTNATKNTVVFNTLQNNDVDLEVLAAGPNNIAHNICSQPGPGCK